MAVIFPFAWHFWWSCFPSDRRFRNHTLHVLLTSNLFIGVFIKAGIVFLSQTWFELCPSNASIAQRLHMARKVFIVNLSWSEAWNPASQVALFCCWCYVANMLGRWSGAWLGGWLRSCFFKPKAAKQKASKLAKEESR